MQNLRDNFSSLIEQLQKINVIAEPHLPDVIIYRQITIVVNFDTAPQCFDNLISWSYSLIFESLSKHYDFLFAQAQKLRLQLSPDAKDLKKSVHHLRTLAQHSQFEPRRLTELNDYKTAWFQKLCSHNEPSSIEEWIICIKNILDTLVEVINCFEQTIIQAVNSEFSQIFIYEWVRSALRTFTPYDYEVVVVTVLADHGLSNKLDPSLFTKRYLNDWQRGIEILPDEFVFEREVYPIIQRSFEKQEIIPVDGADLIKAGIPKGQLLGKCLTEARKSFYADPCNGDQLIERMVSWYKNEITKSN